MSSGAVQLLQKSLQDAHKSLEYNSNALKKLTGRDPAVPPFRSGPTPERKRSSGESGRMRAWSGDYEGPASKRRDSVGGRSRLAGRLGPPVWQEGGERGEQQQTREERAPGRGGGTDEREMRRGRETGERALRRDSGEDGGEMRRGRGTGEREMRGGGRALRRESGEDGGEMRRGRGTGEREMRGGGRALRRESGEDGGEMRRGTGEREMRGGGRALRRESGEDGREMKRQRREDSEGEDQEIEEESKPSLQSSVVATTAPPRPNVDPTDDGKNKMRNRRMFGFLMGTLQKFKDSEEASKNSEKEMTRKAIERKLEETAAEEKETIAQERRELFQKIKNEKKRVSRIESHLGIVAEFEEWNAHYRKLLGYIQTRSKPPIFYLPAQHNSESTEALKRTTNKIEGAIKERQTEIDAMLAEATAPIEGGGGGDGGNKVEGGEEGDMMVVPVVASSVGEGGGAREGREMASDSD